MGTNSTTFPLLERNSTITPLIAKSVLLEYVLSLDASLGAVYARDYLSLLDEVSKLSTDISAIQMDTGYSGIINRMYSLVYTHIAVYLQNMNKALEANDGAAATQALTQSSGFNEGGSLNTGTSASQSESVGVNAFGVVNGSIGDTAGDSTSLGTSWGTNESVSTGDSTTVTTGTSDTVSTGTSHPTQTDAASLSANLSVLPNRMA